MRDVIIFAAGAAIGSLVTWLFLKKKYEKENEENLKDIRDYYETEIRQKEGRIEKAEEAMGEAAVIVKNPEEGARTDYTAFADNGGDDVSEVSNYISGEDDTNEHLKERFDPPKIIKSESAGEKFGWDYADLEYYVNDDVLCTESGEIVDVFETVGDCFDKFDFRHNEDTKIYVRNFRHMTDYEISKVFASYVDAYGE